MAQEVKSAPGRYDFAFPASSTAAASIPGELNSVPDRPFYSPLVVVAKKDTVDALKAFVPTGNFKPLVKDGPKGSNVQMFDMDAYRTDFNTVAAGRPAGLQWQDIDPHGTHPALRGQVMISTTDPTSSSSAANYLAVMSYLQNNSQVVANSGEIDGMRQFLQNLTQRQGALLASSDELVKDILSDVGRPLIWTYESEVAELARAGSLPSNVVVLYPDTTIQSDHTVVELTPKAAAFANLLQNDPQLRLLEEKFGFRPTGDPTSMVSALAQNASGFAADVTQIGAAQAAPPTSEMLQKIATTAVTTS
jgi:hypothetical protein